MPRGRSNDDRLADLTRRLKVMEEKRDREARTREIHGEYTDAEIEEIMVLLLRHVHDGDTERFAAHLQELGFTFEEAAEIARITEERDGGVVIPR